jgi:hypothetical protein
MKINLFFLKLFLFSCILNISKTQFCKDVDAPPIILQCNFTAGTFIYKPFSGSELVITSSNTPIPTKYDIKTNISQNTLTLTVKTLDKYDSGSDTYYTKIDNDKYCTYDILLFSKY